MMMTTVDIIVIVLCVAIVVAVTVTTVVRKIKGKPSSCCDCSSCTACDHGADSQNQCSANKTDAKTNVEDILKNLNIKSYCDGVSCSDKCACSYSNKSKAQKSKND